MNALWRFLRDKRNQQVLGWLGGGLVVAATGLWVAFVYFFPPVKSPEAKSPSLEVKSSEPMPPSVQANCGGIAIGHDVTGSTITAGAASPVSSGTYGRASEMAANWAHSSYRVHSPCAGLGSERVFSALCLRARFLASRF